MGINKAVAGWRSLWLNCRVFAISSSNGSGGITIHAGTATQPDVSGNWFAPGSNPGDFVQTNFVPPRRWNRSAFYVRSYWYSSEAVSPAGSKVATCADAVLINSGESFNQTWGTRVIVSQVYTGARNLHVSPDMLVTPGGNLNADTPALIALRLGRLASDPADNNGNNTYFMGAEVLYNTNTSIDYPYD